MNYFIITEPPSIIRASAFARALGFRWPLAAVEEIHNPASSHALEFSIPAEDGNITGSRNREECSIAFIGGVQDVAEFSLWCREFIPSNEKVTLCDESMSGCLDLTPSTTLAEAIQTFDPAMD